MSWWVKEQISINEDGDESLCDIECDDAASLPAVDQTATAGFTIVRGSSAKDIATGDKYIMGSAGTWVKQPSEFQLDLAGYATEQYVDDALADIVSDFNTDQQRQETEIGVVAALGAKNLFNIDATPTVYHTIYTLTNGELTVTANGNWGHYSVPLNLPAGSYILSTAISGYSKASGAPDTSMRLRMAETTSSTTSIVLHTITGNGAVSVPFTWSGGQIYLQFYPNYNGTPYVNSFVAENTMIRRAEVTDSTYAPYAPTNRELYEMFLAL